MSATTEKVKVPVKVHQAMAASARRGAKFLDVRMPGWYRKVSTSKLKMADACKCIYGQLNAHNLLCQFDDAKFHLGLHCYANGNTVDAQFGYILPETKTVTEWLGISSKYISTSGERQRYDAAWDALQEEWLREIAIRRGAKLEAVAV